MKTAHLEYKRALIMGDAFVVRTWVDDIQRTDVKVRFEILRQTDDRLKIACEGWFAYTMVSLSTGRAEAIPEWITAKYAV